MRKFIAATALGTVLAGWSPAFAQGVGFCDPQRSMQTWVESAPSGVEIHKLSKAGTEAMKEVIMEPTSPLFRKYGRRRPGSSLRALQSASWRSMTTVGVLWTRSMLTPPTFCGGSRMPWDKPANWPAMGARSARPWYLHTPAVAEETGATPGQVAIA